MFYDTHAHVDYPEFASDLDAVMERAQNAGIARIVSVGTDLESSRRAIALAERFSPVYASVGWHPSYAEAAPEDLRPALKALASHPKVVAIGETGLDYHRLPSGKEGGKGSDDAAYKNKQAQVFQQQLEVAAELGLNCIIHQRDCFEDAMAQMLPFAGKVRGVFHCFANDAASMRRVIDADWLVSFTGILTFKNAASVRETLEATPLDKFMLETDCPYLAPVPFRGKRGEPAYVREIAECAAATKKCSLEALSEATCATAREFFPKLG